MQLSLAVRAARRMRSLHFVPGGVQKFLDKALASKADTIIIDLEDAVAPADKLTARKEVSRWLDCTDFGKKSVCVRINALDTDLWEEDLAATMRKGSVAPHLYMIPKVSGPACVLKIGDYITKLEKSAGRPEGETGLLPIVTEVPQAPLLAHEVAKAPRVEALTWGAEDLSAELGAKTNRQEDGAYMEVFKLCRSLTLLAAKGANVQAIDGVYTDIRDTKGCAAEAQYAADTGFDGKMTIHPDQINVVNAAFTPSAEELSSARELLQAASGQDGAFKWKGKMIDRPHLKQAQRMLDRVGDDEVEVADAAPAKPKWPEGPHHGKWFEELTEGRIIQHALTRTVTEMDNTLFTTLSMNTAKLHLDYESAKATQFKKPLVNSMFTVALLVGCSVLETTHGTTIANLGFDEVMFPTPVFIGDTIRAETEVIKARRSEKNPTRGIVTFEHRAFNQDGKLVCRARRNALMNCKPKSAL